VVTTVSFVTNPVSAIGSIQAQGSGASGISFTWVILLVLVLFWVFMIMQSRRRKQQQLQQRQSMDPGTRVMLTSGIIGTLVERTPDTMVVEVADGVQLTVVPGAIARTMPTLDPSADDVADVGAYEGADDLRDDTDLDEPTYTDTTSEGDRDTVTDDRDGQPTDGSTQGRRDTGTGESAIQEGR
jgi:preprotein translocase subunit YajC